MYKTKNIILTFNHSKMTILRLSMSESWENLSIINWRIEVEAKNLIDRWICFWINFLTFELSFNVVDMSDTERLIRRESSLIMKNLCPNCQIAQSGQYW